MPVIHETSSKEIVREMPQKTVWYLPSFLCAWGSIASGHCTLKVLRQFCRLKFNSYVNLPSVQLD